MHRGQDARCFVLNQMENLKFFWLGREPNQRGKARWRAGSWLPVHLSRLGFALFFVSAPARPDESNDQNHIRFWQHARVDSLSSDVAPERVSQRGPSVAVDGGAAPQSEGGDTFFSNTLAAARRKQGRSFLSSGSPPRRIRQETRHALSHSPHPHRTAAQESKQGSSTRKSFFLLPCFPAGWPEPRAVAPSFRLQRAAARSASSADDSSSRLGSGTPNLDAVPDRVHVPVGVCVCVSE